MEQKIIEIIAEYQGRPAENYRADQKFSEMGLDSLDLAELIVQLEEEGAVVELSPEINTPEKLAAAIKNK
ncbi:MAG: acyl carrier protein [Ruminococcaceae bacterium]|nr:acyl carrier protein [Oscillospiraceae bacterium]